MPTPRSTKARPVEANPGSGGHKPATNPQPEPPIVVRRYVKPNGWTTRYWAVYTGQELLAVVVYKKGAEAVADKLRGLMGVAGVKAKPSV